MNKSQCFFPDRSQSYATVPCNPTVPHSSCCTPGEQCTSSGLCIATSGLTYRGACTDVDWRDPSCASVCRDFKTVDKDNENAMNGGGFMRVVSYGTGNRSTMWTCDFWNQNSDNITSVFPYKLGEITQINITGNVADYVMLRSRPASETPISSSTPLPSSSNSTSPPSSTVTVLSESKDNSKAGTIGAAVASAILGLLLIAAFGWIVIERKKRTAVEAALVEEKRRSEESERIQFYAKKKEEVEVINPASKWAPAVEIQTLDVRDGENWRRGGGGGSGLRELA